MKKGFTLIELLVIIAIIGLLAVLLIGEVKDFKMKKYLITTGKESFYTDSYLVDSKTNCLEFDEKIVCGNYTIKN